MGGELVPATYRSARPTFMVSAWKDADGANLDRVQIVKGWLGGDGKTHEKVYDIALSDDRKVSAKTGRAPAVGNTVDTATASYRNDIGSAYFSKLWSDPDFDPEEAAFYYVRVLEIPTPRWTAYDAAYFNLELPEQVPLVTQERAYTAPIWYQP